MVKHKAVLGLIALALILGMLLFLSWTAISERKMDVYDSQSYGPEGLKAVNLLLARSGYHVVAVNQLPADRQNLLIVVTTGLSPRQQRHLLGWIKSGGTLVELSFGSPALRISGNQFGYLNTRMDRFHPSPFNKFLTDLNYHLSGSPVAVITDPQQGFYGTKHRFFLYRQSLGAGNLIAWNDPGGLTNSFLKRHPDNGVIFAAIVQQFSPSAKIAFYNLAFKAEQGQTIRHPRMVWNHYWGGALLLCLCVILAVWKLAARFGRPRPLQLASGRSYDEFVYSLAGLFRQAKLTGFVLDNLWRDLLKTMADLTRLPADTDPEQLIAAMNRLTGKEYRPLLELHSVLNGLAARSNAKLSAKQFLMIVSKLDDYRKEFRAWKKSNQFAAKSN